MRPATTPRIAPREEPRHDDDARANVLAWAAASSAGAATRAAGTLGLHSRVADRRSRADPHRHLPSARLHGVTARQPRPTNGIFVAMTVRNCTFAESGRL